MTATVASSEFAARVTRVLRDGLLDVLPSGAKRHGLRVGRRTATSALVSANHERSTQRSKAIWRSWEILTAAGYRTDLEDARLIVHERAGD